MGRAFETITDPIRTFIEKQHLFFVATAPSGDDGRVNLSPKGYDSLRVLGPNRVAYLDLTGSGAETIAHVRDNGRITFMFCAFEGKPNIIRLYGTGRVVLPGDDEFAALQDLFTADGAARSVIVADIDRTSTSCGFAVPFMEYTGERDALAKYAEKWTDDELEAYHAEKNAVSIDGLPALSDLG